MWTDTSADVICFGLFELRPAQRGLFAGGQPVPLGARAFDLLLALVEHRDRVVAPGDLFERVWPGVVVEENNLRQQVAALRKVLGTGAIVTVAGRGYRFALAVTEASALPRPSTAALPLSGPVLALPARPSIAVLPFTVLSDVPRIGFLADGLVEDVIALLARVPGFLLISQGSTFQFRKRSDSLTSIALQLGVRYIVEGSVRPVGEGLRVSTQLVEATSGRVLWSGRFDGSSDDTANFQEGIARGIISELEPQLMRAEIGFIRRERPSNLDAWRCYRQAIAAFAVQGWNEPALREARAQLQAALVADPSFTLARATFSLFTALGLTTGVLAESDGARSDAREAAEEALSADDDDAQVLGFCGCALADLGEHRRGLEILERALQIDPSAAQAHVAVGATLALEGRWEEAIEKMRYGMRISPRDRRLGFWGWFLGRSLLAAGRPEEALQESLLSASRDPRLFLSRILQAAALQALGRPVEAAVAFRAARQLRPQLTHQEVLVSHSAIVGRDVEPLWERPLSH
jgi:TolB-like protein/Tfp pilus assembly protein PilF